MESESAMCETCLERGRERQADVVTADLAMCNDCYTGKPFRLEETVGAPRQQVQQRSRRYREYQREYKRRNRERIRDYYRKWRNRPSDDELSRMMLSKSN